MENLKRLKPTRGRAALMAATICMIVPAHAEPTTDGAGTANLELSKRYESIEEARVLLHKGDEAYNSGDFSTAVETYAGARDLTPQAPATSEFRAFLTERYVQSSVELAKKLSREGDIKGAKAAIEKVLIPAVAPNDPAALKVQAELNDPIRTNPALTKEHAEAVDQVRKLLYKADGFYELGDFDKSKKTYEDVLRVDPTNSAARRGMEKVAAAKTNYQQSAYDHTRAELLGETDKAWELNLNPLPIDPNLLAGEEATTSNAFIPVQNKIERIIFPSVDLDQASLDETIEYLRARATELDTTELDPARKGVNFNLNLGDSSSPEVQAINAKRINLHLKNTPLSTILDYVTQSSGTIYSTDDFGVVINSPGTFTSRLITRTYKVPADFLSNISANVSSPAATEATDPFSTAPSTGMLPKRMTVEEVFKLSGIGFPEGASASLNPSNGTLRVVNSLANLNIIDQIVASAAQTQPVLVKVSVTIIKTEQTNLDELGFDWTLDNFGFGSAVMENNQLNLSGGTQGNGYSLSDMLNNYGAPSGNPVTAGNRSGDSAVSGDAMSSLIAAGNDRTAVGAGTARAPGVLSVFGTIDTAQVNMLMRGLAQKKNVDVMTKPSTITRSDQAAKIEVIREFPYPTEYEPPELPNTIESNDVYDGGVLTGTDTPSFIPVTPAHPTSFERKNVGVTLEVLPTVDAHKRNISVTLNPDVSEFEGFVNYGSPINTPNPISSINPLASATIPLTQNNILMPVFSHIRLSDSVTVADGHTIVLGGMLKEDIQNVNDHTPILGDIPLLGRLFQSNSKQSVSTAIMVLVNVELTDATGHPFNNR
ncbi:hypothetical protein JIN85_04115 [Luteolibacter pohnpeiensis]|uniref:Type II/III secretion system secretin-like domain-containing protein n=1 Tax=Luteolibacter pohnpeiensis TaxID=454153 RepID=A0A934VUX2_9BACT|nr:Amuc_1098 family type IV pilus outer membrane protein [Luteolibacter pohnpeiensis]MBK1881585.1 hypothetical protein [Luteolibacter pohnpeiensis]